MATTVNDRELVGSDISVYLSAQDVKDSINPTPEFFKVRRTGGAPKQAIASTTSAEIKNNQQGSSNIKTSTEQTAEIATEVHLQTKKLIVGAIHAVPDDNSVIGSDIAATATGLTVPGNTFTAGDYLFVTGFANDNLNVTYCVADVVGDEVETTVAPVALEAAGSEVAVSSIKHANGLEPTYFAGQKRQLDKSQVDDTAYSTFLNGLVDGLTIEVPEEGILTSTATMMWEQLLKGYSSIVGQTDSEDDQSDAAGTENEFKKFWIDRLPAECEVKSATFEIANGYQGSPAAGCSKKELGARKFAATGSMVAKSMISNSMDWESKYKDGTRIQLGAEIIWGDGNSMILDCEYVYISEHTQQDGEGFSNNELTLALEENPETNTTIRLFTNF